MGERVESSVGVPMASVLEGWRPLGCLRHEQPVATRKSLLVDNLFDSILSIQVRSRRIADWPLCEVCLKAQRRAQVFCTLVTLATLGIMWFLLARVTVLSMVAQFVVGLVFCAMAALAVGLWRRALMPALSAGLRLSRDCRNLVIKARLSNPSIQVELDEVSASRWY
jgi:hypothetical protein